MFFKMKLFNIWVAMNKSTFSLKVIYSYTLILTFLCVIQESCGNCTLSQSSTPVPTEELLLRTLQPLQGHSFQTQDENYLYYVQICGKANGDVAEGVGAVQYEKDSKKLLHVIGRYDDVEVLGGTDWILLSYNKGDNYSSEHCLSSNRVAMIMIICDPSHPVGELRILEERRKNAGDDCFYLFELGSSLVCSTSSKIVIPTPGIGSGGVFCIIFFTITGIYLLIGFLYQRIVVGAKGLEQIPNYSFWRSFGNLQADGCDYICRCGPRQESQAYRGIDDRIRTDEERDDQLLNM